MLSSVLTQFQTNRSQQVMVDGYRSKLVNVVSVLDPLLFLLYTSELFSILENKLIGYADDSTLIAVVHDLCKVSELFDLWGMKLNASKFETIIVSRSRTIKA